MLLEAIKKEWITEKRWPIELTVAEIEQAIKDKGRAPTVKEIAVLESVRLAKAKDYRHKGIGLKLIVAMGAQNQKDEHHVDGETVNHEISITVEQKRADLTKLAERFGVRNLLDAIPDGNEGEHHSAGNGVHKTNGKPGTNGHAGKILPS